MPAQAQFLDNKELLQEWKSGRNDEHQSGRRSVDKQLNGQSFSLSNNKVIYRHLV